jgi:hypothetical protein
MMTFVMTLSVAGAMTVAATSVEAEPVAAEVNVLWPFIGISEMKVLVPVVGHGERRGELVAGTYLDYAQIVREDSGKAFIIAALPGYRQFIAYGIHVELAFTVGVRHEQDHPMDGATLDDFYIRAWPGVGYQRELGERFYVNARARGGVLVYRQTHQDEEKKLAPAGDVNVGVRF